MRLFPVDGFEPRWIPRSISCGYIHIRTNALHFNPCTVTVTRVRSTEDDWRSHADQKRFIDSIDTYLHSHIDTYTSNLNPFPIENFESRIWKHLHLDPLPLAVSCRLEKMWFRIMIHVYVHVINHTNNKNVCTLLLNQVVHKTGWLATLRGSEKM